MALITDVDDVVTQFTVNQDEFLVTWAENLNNSFSGRVCVQIEQLFPSTVVSDNAFQYPEIKGRMLRGQHQIHTNQRRSYKGRLQMFNKSGDGQEVKTHEITKFFVLECAAQRLLLLSPQNRWNSSDCRSGLYILGDGLTVSRHRFGSARSIFTSVRAKMMIPRHCCGLFYFEVKVEQMCERFRFGLMPKSVPLNPSYTSYSYRSDGTFWGQNVRGSDFADAWPYITNKDAMFGSDNTVGCGLNLATPQMIYTLNEKRLDKYD